MRLKTWWVADLDSAISNLEVDLNKSRPELMQRYANVIDPAKREQLIAKEESNISKQINELSAVRKYRLGTIKDMTDAEIARWEQKLKGLEAQFDLYTSVLWDIEKWDKVQSEIEKTALDIQKKRLELKWLESKYWLEFIPGKTQYWSTDFTSLKDKYPNNASFKNNNPGNIKYNEQWANTLKQYGIEIQKGSEALDGWNFARYNSVEDAIVGRDILLFQTSTYPNMTVDNAMKRYSNNGYWAEIVPSVNWNKLMKDLTSAEQTKLIMWQLKWEDQAMYQELISSGIDPTRLVVEWQYKKTGLTESEQKEADKLKESEQYNITTAEDFNKLQKTSSSNAVTKMTPEFVDKTLEDNIWKWDISSWDVDDLLKKSSDDIYNTYIKAELVNNLTNETNADVIVKTVKDSLESYSEDEMLEILKEAWIFDKEWLKKGFFNDDAWYDKLQELLPSL